MKDTELDREERERRVTEITRRLGVEEEPSEETVPRRPSSFWIPWALAALALLLLWLGVWEGLEGWMGTRQAGP